MNNSMDKHTKLNRKIKLTLSACRKSTYIFVHGQTLIMYHAHWHKKVPISIPGSLFKPSIKTEMPKCRFYLSSHSSKGLSPLYLANVCIDFCNLITSVMAELHIHHFTIKFYQSNYLSFDAYSALFSLFLPH